LEFFRYEQRIFFYILASKRNGTLYVGVTDDLITRIGDHKKGTGGAFTKKYNVKILVHTESYPTPEEAIHREKCLKKWNRAWKIELIEADNPLWNDLYPA
jgi:putative endonuclease